ncbi:MAG: hypothetical protein P1V35_17065, partial [Planctomycetota bacterium]|nr:hypothetical protein [Planctomycetota bacterium]
MQALLAILCLCFAVGPARGQGPEARDYIQFEVETHTGHFRNPQPVPHVGFEVLPLGEGPFAAVLHAGTTDAKGMATVSLAAEFGGDEHPNVIVRVKQGGKSQSHGKWKKEVPGVSLGGPVSQLAIRDGWTCYWRIEDPSGAVVDGDFGWKFTVQGPKGRPRNRGRDRFRDRQLGPGWVSADSTGSDPIDFWAWKLGVGSVVHSGKEPWDIGRDGGALVLQPASTLRGRLLDSEGQAIAQTELFVRKAGTDWLPKSALDSPRVRLGESLTEKGLGVGLCTTQRDGRFELAGLEPGNYELLVYSDSSEVGEWKRVGPKVVSTESVEPVLHFGQPAFQVRLFTSDGNPWSGKYKKPKRNSFSFDWEREGALHQWPATPQMIVRELTPGDPTGLKHWKSKGVHWIPPNAMVAPVRSGRTYVVQVIGGGFTGEAHRFKAGADGALSSIDVMESPSTIPGKLVVTPKHGNLFIGEDQYDNDFGLWVAD